MKRVDGPPACAESNYEGGRIGLWRTSDQVLGENVEAWFIIDCVDFLGRLELPEGNVDSVNTLVLSPANRNNSFIILP